MTHHRIPSLLLLSALLSAPLAGQAIEVASENAAGDPADAGSGSARITADGRYIVFHSDAGNLVPGDTNGVWDVFLRDTVLDTIERVSVSSAGAEGDDHSGYADITDDGRYVVFSSRATNLVAGDTNYAPDVFLRDRTLGTTERVSLSSLGTEQGSGLFDYTPAVSADGRFVAWTTIFSFLSIDYGIDRDVYLRDRSLETTELMSWAEDGSQAAGGWDPSMNAAGTLVAYTSNSHITHALDTDSLDDVFIRDRVLGANELVSLGYTGLGGSGHSTRPRMTPDGRYVVFGSSASDLDAVDTNSASDIFLRDRTAGTTELVSYTSTGAVSSFISGVHTPGCIAPAVSDDGRFVIFHADNVDLTPLESPGVFLRDRSLATTQQVDTGRWWSSFVGDGHTPDISSDGTEAVFSLLDSPPGSGWYDQVFLRHVDDRDSIHLTGSTAVYGGWGYTTSYSADGAPAGATWHLAWSFERSGSTVAGQRFDIGPGATVLASGTIAADGTMSYVSPPVPASVVGRTIWLELAVEDGAGSYLDSNAHELVVI